MSGANHYLALLLDVAGWRPEALARKVTIALAGQNGHGRHVGPKTPYGWLNRGEVPRAPIPEVVVLLLADELAEPVDFDRMWPTATRRSLLWAPADHGFDVSWDQAGTDELLNRWVRDMLRRRGFTAISGAALTMPAWQWLDHSSTPMKAVTRPGASVSPEVVGVIEGTILRLRHLDDAQGGASALDFARDQFDMVARTLRRQSYTAHVGKRLHVALGELGQLTGFMAFDSNQDGLAQRYYLAGLRAAHTAADRGLAASILGRLAYQAADRGKPGDALQLASAAEQGAASSTPRVRAIAQTKMARACAAAGDVSGAARARDQARELINRAEEHPEQDPSWSYWATPSCLDAHAGQALVELATKVPGRHKRLLTEGEALIGPRANVPRTDPYQRSAMSHGALLALAHVHAGELDQAVTAGSRAVDRLPAVNSPRAANLLVRLRAELVPHARRHPATADLVTRLPAS